MWIAVLADVRRIQRQFHRPMRRLLRARLVRNIVALYGMRAFDQLLPLVVF